jgi:hypothetical protein
MAKQIDIVTQGITASLWSLAKSIEQAGKLHESLDPYLKLVEAYPGSKEAPLAAQRVLVIVEYLRGVGQFHLALTLLDRLDAAHQSGAPASS